MCENPRGSFRIDDPLHNPSTAEIGEVTERTCSKGGIYEGTIRHVVFECKGAHYADEEFHSIMGLEEEIEDPTSLLK